MKKITKLKETNSPLFVSGDFEVFVCGLDNIAVSLPVEYTAILDTDDRPVAGFPFTALRVERNGVPALGFFSTSVVREVIEIKDRIVFKTANSVYELTDVEG